MTKEEILIKALNNKCKYESGKEMDYDTHLAIMDAMEEYAQQQVKNCVIMPRISHFRDENGNTVDINAAGVNVRLKRDGTHEYFRSYGFAGKMKLTPVYVA